MNKERFWELLLVVLLLAGLGFFLKDKAGAYLVKFDPEVAQERYLNSQWVKGYYAREKIGDGELYAWAGWEQIQGKDPTLINPEVPPIGRYLIGASIAIFGNPAVVSLFCGVGILVAVFLTGRVLFKKTWLALVAPLLFSWEALFREDLVASMLDLPLTLFVCWAVYFLLKAKKKPLFFLPALVCLGLAVGTKTYLAGFGLVACLCLLVALVSVLKKERKYLKLFWFLPFFGLVYLAGYWAYFKAGRTLADFKYLHFWIRHFALVRVDWYPRGQIFNLLLFGRWQTWWGEFGVIPVPGWSVLWPLSFVAATILGGWALRKANYPLLVVVGVIFAYLGMYYWGVPAPRYLLPILPLLYLCLVAGGKLVVEKKWEKN